MYYLSYKRNVVRKLNSTGVWTSSNRGLILISVLIQVFQELNLKAYDLNVDNLDVHAVSLLHAHFWLRYIKTPPSFSIVEKPGNEANHKWLSVADMRCKTIVGHSLSSALPTHSTAHSATIYSGAWPIYVAVPGRNRTLFRCVFRRRYHIRSAVAQYFR